MGNVINSDSSIELIDPDQKVTFVNILKQSFNFQRLQNPTKTSQVLVNVAILLYVVLSLALGLCITYFQDDLKHAQTWAIAVLSVIGFFMILLVMSIATQPNSRRELRFMVPFVPFIPALSIVVNIYLMIMLDVNTWIRFGVWMAVGLPMYLISIRKCTTSSYSTKMHAKINGVKTNGFIHNGGQDFVHYNNEIKDNSTRTPSPVLTYAINNSLYSSIDIDDALAALDDVLSKEDTVDFESQLSRRVSLDTVSNASNAHCEGSIVALVHNEDAINPVPKIETDNKDEPAKVLKITLQTTPTEDNFKKEHDPSIVIIPPPPPMQDFEKFKTPRVQFRGVSQDDMLYGTLKRKRSRIQRALSHPEIVSHCPSPNFESSRKSSVVEDVDDIIEFGSPQHKKIIGSLNKMLERQQSFSQPNVAHIKPILHRDESTIEPTNITGVLVDKEVKSDVSNENDDVSTPVDIKKKLNEIFRSDPRLKLSPLNKSNIDLTNEMVDDTSAEVPKALTRPPLKPSGYINLNTLKENANAQDDINLHKDLMRNTLKNIKLRKIDSIRNA